MSPAGTTAAHPRYLQMRSWPRSVAITHHESKSVRGRHINQSINRMASIAPELSPCGLGVMTVLRKILRQGNTFTFQYLNVDKHISEMSRSEPVLYCEMRRKFGVGCVVIGYYRIGPDVHLLPKAAGCLNQRTRLNPEEDEELKVGDQLIGIVCKDVSPSPDESHLAASLIASKRAIQRLAKVRAY
jgi:hypothetical protein